MAFPAGPMRFPCWRASGSCTYTNVSLGVKLGCPRLTSLTRQDRSRGFRTHYRVGGALCGARWERTPQTAARSRRSPVCQERKWGVLQLRGSSAPGRAWRRPAASAAFFDDDYAWDEDDDDYFLDEADRPLYLHTSDALLVLASRDGADVFEKLQNHQIVERGRVSVAALASAVASVPVRTASAVETTWAGTADMLRDATEQTRAQVKETAASASEAAAKTPVGRAVKQLQQEWESAATSLPKDLWGRLVWFWERPTFQRLRITISMANLSVRLPAIIALVGTQIGLLATQVSLPMLAPLLLGTGMMFRTIKSNASLIFPRVGLLVVLLWMLWFANSVVQNTVMYLRRQGAIDHRVSGAVINASEMCSLGGALVIMLSIIGINVSALLIPAGVAVAIAAKDLSHNFLAGFFLFAVQPFKLGDRVGVSTSASMPGVGTAMAGGWFEGVCEKVDLRYTTIKSGRRRLLVPNSAFITREFMILDDAADPASPRRPEPGQPTALNPGQQPQHDQQQAGNYEWVRRSLESQPFHREQQPQYAVQGPGQLPPPFPYAGDSMSPNGMHQPMSDWHWSQRHQPQPETQYAQQRWPGDGSQHHPSHYDSAQRQRPEQEQSAAHNGSSSMADPSSHSEHGSERSPLTSRPGGRRRSSDAAAEDHYKGRSPSRPKYDNGGAPHQSRSGPRNGYYYAEPVQQESSHQQVRSPTEPRGPAVGTGFGFSLERAPGLGLSVPSAHNMQQPHAVGQMPTGYGFHSAAHGSHGVHRPPPPDGLDQQQIRNSQPW